VILVVLMAFASTSPEGAPTWPPSWEGLRQAAGFGILGFSAPRKIERSTPISSMKKLPMAPKTQ
jgi:hypothetical protein